VTGSLTGFGISDGTAVPNEAAGLQWSSHAAVGVRVPPTCQAEPAILRQSIVFHSSMRTSLAPEEQNTSPCINARWRRVHGDLYIRPCRVAHAPCITRSKHATVY